MPVIEYHEVEWWLVQPVLVMLLHPFVATIRVVIQGAIKATCANQAASSKSPMM